MSTRVAWVSALIGLNERFELLHPFRFRTVKLADGEAVALDMVNDPRHLDGGRRIGDTADDLVAVYVFAQDFARIEGFQLLAFKFAVVFMEIPPGDAVLHGDDHGVVADQRWHLARHLIEMMRLDRQEDDVLGADLADLVGDPDLGHVFGTIFPNELEAVLPDRLQLRSAGDNRDVLTGKPELDGQHSADGASTDNANFHIPLPRLPIGRLSARFYIPPSPAARPSIPDFTRRRWPTCRFPRW
jgi:hypothetical protein